MFILMLFINNSLKKILIYFLIYRKMFHWQGVKIKDRYCVSVIDREVEWIMNINLSCLYYSFKYLDKQATQLYYYQQWITLWEL